MSLFKEFVEGFTSGFVSVASERQLFNSTSRLDASKVVETCCQQLGWSIDERLNANEVCLHFNDPWLGFARCWFALETRIPLWPSRSSVRSTLQRSGSLLASWAICFGGIASR